MVSKPNPSEPFDRTRRRLVRDRAFARAAGTDFLTKILVEEIFGRLALVKRQFGCCLAIGSGAIGLKPGLERLGIKVVLTDAGYRAPQEEFGVQCDEDRLPFADGSFDLIINVATLDTVNDLPGSLVLMNRLLRPDGLLLAIFVGAGSLPVLKSVLMEADGNKISPHIHPQIDVRTMGDLMQRARFALPVVDSDRLNLNYSSIERLVKDLRNFGGSNVLAQNIEPFSEIQAKKARLAFRQRANSDGKTTETIELISICGWAPHPDQPKPAARGSGQTSLKTALQKKTDK